MDRRHLRGAHAGRPAANRARVRGRARKDDQGADLGNRGRPRPGRDDRGARPAGLIARILDRMRTLVVVASALVLAGCTGPAHGPRASAPPVATQAQPTASSPTVGLPYPDWPTYHGDAARTGVSVTMQPARGAPRLVASLKLDGAVYASPLVVAGTTIVATENDSVYALTGSGRQLWRTHLGTPSPAGERPCGNIDPLGITGCLLYTSPSPRDGLLSRM